MMYLNNFYLKLDHQFVWYSYVKCARTYFHGSHEVTIFVTYSMEEIVDGVILGYCPV